MNKTAVDPIKISVTERALIQRINRKLSPNSERLVKTRGQKMQLDVGDYYVIDMTLNCVSHKHFDLEVYGREIGCLRDWETLEG